MAYEGSKPVETPTKDVPSLGLMVSTTQRRSSLGLLSSMKHGGGDSTTGGMSTLNSVFNTQQSLFSMTQTETQMEQKHIIPVESRKNTETPGVNTPSSTSNYNEGSTSKSFRSREDVNPLNPWIVSKPNLEKEHSNNCQPSIGSIRQRRIKFSERSVSTPNLDERTSRKPLHQRVKSVESRSIGRARSSPHDDSRFHRIPCPPAARSEEWKEMHSHFKKMHGDPGKTSGEIEEQGPSPEQTRRMLALRKMSQRTGKKKVPGKRDELIVESEELLGSSSSSKQRGGLLSCFGICSANDEADFVNSVTMRPEKKPTSPASINVQT
mmetsp:Transcript_12252/g.22289  ORF Transcript_12252/g.22289 Transcript_12252/m.22289 type:complete len:323 (+) Transcript_12252:139-1107(+)|eukprot:CAMPEP_0197515878 /NCGR_PEP_ID=MMETSP1318-20131121/856_1 /TAXON_ID=552666 /ORGANISM="Partenskyella glossopodia, Strain RCC365" /LENGTH=322 /DNA_ID=CAMNT_0043064351 /DNA_START=86 /DNA_END=1054 /DNA_ORIENTATION=-